MDWKKLIVSLDEKPLDKLTDNGGFASIFRRIAVVGDSLSSGEFQVMREDGVFTYHDFYEYSWGEFIGRTIGAHVDVFARGGMTASEYLGSFADNKGYWDRRLAAQAYIIALGVNDVINQGLDVGVVGDVDFDDYKNNKPTFAGDYAKIIQRYLEIEPNAFVFLVTMPRDSDDSAEVDGKKREHAKLLNDLAQKMRQVYVIDLYKYAPVYDEEFKSTFMLHGHMNPMGYNLTAQMIVSYIDYYIRRDFAAFKKVGLIGHPQYKND